MKTKAANNPTHNSVQHHPPVAPVDELFKTSSQLQALSPEELLTAQQRGALLIDVRQPQEYATGYLPEAQLMPIDNLEQQLLERGIDRQQPLVLYCAVGQRSERAGQQLSAQGYQHLAHLSGGLQAWEQAGRELSYPADHEMALSAKQYQRYSRQILLPEVGPAGQSKLLASRVLLIGAGGLGSPAALYLAAAGVGTLGLVDDDRVEESNLQRQILHRQAAIGQSKASSGAATLQELNPEVTVNEYRQRFSVSGRAEIISEYDLIVDGSDNFATRYLLNDLALAADKPLVSAAILGFSGQMTTIIPGQGPCYRCLYRQPPPPELAPSCAANGILGAVAGMFGVLQANEALKILLGIGQPLVGRLLLADLLTMDFNTLRFAFDPDCPACAPGAAAMDWDDRDYQQFCSWDS